MHHKGLYRNKQTKNRAVTVFSVVNIPTWQVLCNTDRALIKVCITSLLSASGGKDKNTVGPLKKIFLILQL